MHLTPPTAFSAAGSLRRLARRTADLRRGGLNHAASPGPPTPSPFRFHSIASRRSAPRGRDVHSHSNDLAAVASGEHLEALLSAPVCGDPMITSSPSRVTSAAPGCDGRRACGSGRSRPHGPRRGRVEGTCVLPQMTMRDAAPFALVCDQLGERARVALVECFCRGTELVDHARIHGRAAVKPRLNSRGRR